MKIFKHNKCNSTVTAADHGAKHPDIPVYRELGDNGRTCKLESFWEPTKTDLLKLASGHCLKMTRVVGAPITLEVVPK